MIHESNVPHQACWFKHYSVFYSGCTCIELRPVIVDRSSPQSLHTSVHVPDIWPRCLHSVPFPVRYLLPSDIRSLHSPSYWRHTSYTHKSTCPRLTPSHSQTSAPAYAGLPATVKWGTVHEWLGAGKKYHVPATNVHCFSTAALWKWSRLVIQKKRMSLNKPSPASKRLHYWQWKHNFWKTMHSSVFCYMYFAIIREILQQHTW
jgi:hypothetical protein